LNLKCLFFGVVLCWPLLGIGQEPDEQEPDEISVPDSAAPSPTRNENTLYEPGPGTPFSFICLKDVGPINRAKLISLSELVTQRIEHVSGFIERYALCDADLNRTNLEGTKLKYYTLYDSDLSRARLERADLSFASLFMSDLSRAVLVGAKLSEADLSQTDLSGANFENADLSGTDLGWADLSGANLNDSILTNTRMTRANLSGVSYAPKTYPNAEDIAQADCLHLLKRDDIHNDPRGLVALRNSLRLAGYREQERQVTYALRRSDFFTQRLPVVQKSHDDSECVEFTTERLADKRWVVTQINYILFELPTGWGMYPSRALTVLFLLIPFFAIPYTFALRSARRDGIWRVWSDERAREDQGSDKPELLLTGLPGAVRLGLYFSLISAFRVGWRDFNVGTWISRLQTREYSLRASGWVRTVAGIQSLVSLYLLAMWALTYFGRPFG